MSNVVQRCHRAVDASRMISRASTQNLVGECGIRMLLGRGLPLKNKVVDDLLPIKVDIQARADLLLVIHRVNLGLDSHLELQVQQVLPQG
jgi:hypothetical protein